MTTWKITSIRNPELALDYAAWNGAKSTRIQHK